MLGYSTRLARPTFVDKSARRVVNRGPGVRYELMQIPGMNMEFVIMHFAARSGFRDELTHEGMDALYAVTGELVLRVNHIDYPISAGECVVYSAAYPHSVRNDSARQASAFGITTAQM
jgi:mannose-6-phosphate isomerase-like protein (cupin superfamily)